MPANAPAADPEAVYRGLRMRVNLARTFAELAAVEAELKAAVLTEDRVRELRAHIGNMRQWLEEVGYGKEGV